MPAGASTVSFLKCVSMTADVCYSDSSCFSFQRMIANTVKILRYCRSQPFSECTSKSVESLPVSYNNSITH